MKLKYFAAFIYLWFGFIQAIHAQTFKTTKYAGVYSFGKSAETGPVGQVTIYPESDTTVLFYIDVCRGAPSYNLGQRYERLKIKDGKATFYSKEEFDKKGCKWKISINGGILTIKTLDQCDECGFGANVYADYQYARKKWEIPGYFIDGHSRKIYFNKTSPEDYER